VVAFPDLRLAVGAEQRGAERAIPTGEHDDRRAVTEVAALPVGTGTAIRRDVDLRHVRMFAPRGPGFKGAWVVGQFESGQWDRSYRAGLDAGGDPSDGPIGSPRSVG